MALHSIKATKRNELAVAESVSVGPEETFRFRFRFWIWERLLVGTRTAAFSRLLHPALSQCLLLVSSWPELEIPFWGWVEPEPRPYNLPQYFASSMLSSKKSCRRGRIL